MDRQPGKGTAGPSLAQHRSVYDGRWNYGETRGVYDWDFDFDVDVDPAIETIEQGSKASPTVVVKKIRGQGNVDLTVTKWDGINAYLTNPSVTPTETTTLNIETTCDTKVGNYLFTVQGETKDSFKTSVDSVSIQVTKNPSC